MGCTASSVDASGHGHGMAALVKSVQAGHVTAVSEMLRDAPALLTAFDRLGVFANHADTPLHIACEAGKFGVVAAILRFLDEAPLDVACTALHALCRREGVAPPSTSTSAVRLAVNVANSKGQTPLMYAAFGGHADITRLLLARGSDPWIGDRCGSRTALHYAAIAGSNSCIVALMEDTPIGLQVLNNVRYINVRSMCGLVPLHYAVCGDNLSAVRLLLRYEPNITAASTGISYDSMVISEMRSTPLHLAAQKGCSRVVYELLRHWAQRAHTGQLLDPRLRRDAAGRWPWQVAQLHGHPELAEILDPTRDAQTLLAWLGGGDALPFGPEPSVAVPRLCTLAAAALQQKLLHAIEAAEQDLALAQLPAVAAAGTSGRWRGRVARGGTISTPAVQSKSLRHMMEHTPSAAELAAQAGQLQRAMTARSKAAAAGMGTTVEEFRGRSSASLTDSGGGKGGVGDSDADDEDDVGGDDDEYDRICQICFVNAVHVSPASCHHGLCASCATEMCRAAGLKPLLCPFCRVPVGDFVSTVGA